MHLKRGLKPAFLLAVLVFTSSCAHRFQHEVLVEQDAFVSVGDGESQLVKKGGKVLVPSDEVTKIEAPGYSSVMIPPSSNRSARFVVSLRPTEGWGNDLVSKQLDEELSSILISFNQVQSTLAKKNPEKAFSMVTLLEKKYPRVLSLRILKAKTLMAMNRSEEAKTVLQSIAQDFPENRTTKKFLELFLKEPQFRLPATSCGEEAESGDLK